MTEKLVEGLNLEEVFELYDYIKENEIPQKINKSYLYYRNIYNDPNFWDNNMDPKIKREVVQMYSKLDNLKVLIEDIETVKEMYTSFKNNNENENFDKDITNILYNSITELIEGCLSLESDLENHDYNKYPCFLQIKIGLGGFESYLWVKMLTEMYLKFFNKYNIKHNILEFQDESYGYRYVNIKIDEPYSYGFLRNEHGSHRLIEISPFSKKRQTTIGIVEVIPDIPNEEINISPNELKIETFRASGHGGQYVNRTESGVRITHIPTGISVSIQTERSQHQNKELAMKILYYKLQELYEKQQEKELNEHIESVNGDMGGQIRSYILHPYKIVKDSISDLEEVPEKVLDTGEKLNKFLLFNTVKRLSLNLKKLKG